LNSAGLITPPYEQRWVMRSARRVPREGGGSEARTLRIIPDGL
jgi:hypothetical protein